MLSLLVLVSLVPAYLVAAEANVACTSGVCTYQSGDGSTTAYSLLSINTESPNSLSDITSAAGWDIIECDPYSVGPQDIRLVCTDRSKGCDQLFEGGEENTIVRLPNSCAGGPFARVVKSWIPEDQSVPARLARRQLDAPVRALTLDFDFAQIPESKGRIYITASATNNVLQRNAITQSIAKRSLKSLRHVTRNAQASALIREFVEAGQKRSSKSSRRGLFDSIGDAFNNAKDAVSNAVDNAKDAVSSAVDNAGDAFQNAGSAIADGAENIANSVTDGVQRAGDIVGNAGDAVQDAGSAIVDGASNFADSVTDGVQRAGDVLGDAGDALQNAGSNLVDNAGDALQNAGNAIANGAQQVGDTLGEIIDTTTGAVESFVQAIGDGTQFNEAFSRNVSLIDIDQSFPLLSASLNCKTNNNTNIGGGVAITAAVQAKLDADIGFIVTGSIVPPQIDDLAFTALLNGNIAAAFDIKANAQGTIDSGAIQLLQVGIPGLSFPGILTVGPSLSLNAQAKATLGVTADINVKSTFDLPQVSLVFPPDQGESSAQVIPGDTPLKVDIGSSAELKARAEAHLIPRLDIGVEILEGLAQATVFLNVDGSAALDLTLSAGADLTPISGTIEDPIVNLSDVDTRFGGTVSSELGVSINAGATAALEPFFDQTAQVQLFSKTFPIFSKSFGDAATTKRSVPILEERAARSRGLKCPSVAGDVTLKQPILDLTAPAPTQ